MLNAIRFASARLIEQPLSLSDSSERILGAVSGLDEKVFVSARYSLRDGRACCWLFCFLMDAIIHYQLVKRWTNKFMMLGNFRLQIAKLAWRYPCRKNEPVN